MSIEASVVLDSVSPDGHRLTTFKLRYPRFIHAEYMTHRVFSRNSSSSRAAPVAKRIAEVRDPLLRATPVWWGREQGGMQAKAELEDERDGMPNLTLVKTAWARAALDAARWAEEMAKAGAHKQLVNRILEPFTHIDVVCTATEYMNFFGLRLDAGAQPEMRALAEAMWSAYGESEPYKLEPGHWHLPFVDLDTEWPDDKIQECIRVSVARCARVSYKSHATGRRSTVAEDLALYERLVGSQPLHASPAEHQATPDQRVPYYGEVGGRWEHPDEHRNYVGWRMYRAMLPGEAVAPLPEGYR